MMPAGAQPNSYDDQWPFSLVDQWPPLLKEQSGPVPAEEAKRIAQIFEQLELESCARWIEVNGLKSICGLKCGLCAKN